MKRFWALLVGLILAVSPLRALAEETDENDAVDVLGMSLQEYAELNQNMPEEPAEDFPFLEPFVPDSLEKAVIGRDDRITISNVSQYPYSAIGFMVVTPRCSCNQWTGTCFMVSHYTAMTCAHCVCCTEHGVPAKKIEIYFGFQSTKNYLYYYNKPTEFWYGTDFNTDAGRGVSDQSLEWDYAYIKLQEPVGKTTGWFGLRPLNAASFDSSGKYPETCWVTGYRDGLLKTDSGAVYRMNDYRMWHQIDSEPGNSGCPVYDKDYYAIGLHSAHSNSYPENYARIVTPELLQTLRNKDLLQ